MLADKTEAGWFPIPDRGMCAETQTHHGEFIPEHVHHNWMYTDAYEKSREKRGVEGAATGYLTKGRFSKSWN